MLHDFVYMRATCIQLLKIASDGNFYLLFGKLLAFRKLVSAEFALCLKYMGESFHDLS